MLHADAMIERLPLLYRDGELIRQILALGALQLEIFDEDALEVQRAHWFDAALALPEAGALGSLLDIPPEPWQNLQEYRIWVHGLRNARIRHGAVTLEALQSFIEAYTHGYQAAVGIRAVPPIAAWQTAPKTGEPAFIENPPLRRFSLPSAGGIEPLYQFEIEQKGLDETAAGFLLVGLPSGPESAPVIVNLTSGQALVLRENIPPGARLWIRPQPDGGATATLENHDVSDKLYSVSGVEPGVVWDANQVQKPARALRLKRGKNQLWFLSVAQYDVLGLDRFLLGLADLLLEQGRYDQTQFEHALFYQEPATLLRVTWVETQPAVIRVTLPAGALINGQGRLDESLQERARLETSLNLAVGKLKAAGVAASVELEPFHEQQSQMDYLTALLPLTIREGGPTGADALPDAGGQFDVTGYEDSTFR